MPSRLNELGSRSGELVGGDAVDEENCGEEEAEKKKRFVEKFITCVGQEFSGDFEISFVFS